MNFHKSKLWLFLSKTSYWPVNNKVEIFLVKQAIFKTCCLFELEFKDFLLSCNFNNSGIQINIQKECIGAFFLKHSNTNPKESKKIFIKNLIKWQKLIKEQKILRNQL